MFSAYFVLEIQSVYYTFSTSQYGLATFEMLGCYMFLGATVLHTQYLYVCTLV